MNQFWKESIGYGSAADTNPVSGSDYWPFISRGDNDGAGHGMV